MIIIIIIIIINDKGINDKCNILSCDRVTINGIWIDDRWTLWYLRDHTLWLDFSITHFTVSRANT
jgi:hypothetical protein